MSLLHGDALIDCQVLRGQLLDFKVLPAEMERCLGHETYKYFTIVSMVD